MSDTPYHELGPGSRLLSVTLGGRGAPFRWGGLRRPGLGDFKQTRPTGHQGFQGPNGLVPLPITREQLQKGEAQLGRARPLKGGDAVRYEDRAKLGGYRPHQGPKECTRRAI